MNHPEVLWRKGTTGAPIGAKGHTPFIIKSVRVLRAAERREVSVLGMKYQSVRLQDMINVHSHANLFSLSDGRRLLEPVFDF